MSAIQTIKTAANIFDDLSGLIADPPEDKAIAGAVGNAGRRLCDAYGNLRLSEQLLTGPGRPIIDLLCKPYYDGQGFDPPVQLPPPFPGGQCEGVSYNVTIRSIPYQSASCQPGAPADRTATRIGPIQGLRFETILPSGSPLCTPAGNRVFIDGATPASDPTDGYGWGIESEIISVVRADGQPDLCGDPPTELGPGLNPPPDPGPYLVGEEPGVNPDGQPFFFVPPIEIPGFDPIPLEDEPLGGVPPEPPTVAGGDGLPGDPDAIAPESGEVTGGEDDGEDIDFGEPPEGRIWVGCIVQTTSDSRIGNIAGTGPRSTVWPSIRGNVALKYGSLYGTSQRINSRFHEVFRPNTSLIVTGCFLQAQPGSTLKVFPISAIKCPNNPCNEE